MTDDEAREALKALLWELPAEFCQDPKYTEPRGSFVVIKKHNVRKVHRALWELQKHFGMTK